MEHIICNPLNLEYRYQIKKMSDLPIPGLEMLSDGKSEPCVYREAADPTVVLFRDTYFLFASMSGGFWYSDDLCNWGFKETPELPSYDYAPDVRQIGDAIVFSASKIEESSALYRCDDPLAKSFEKVSTPFPFHDPDIFQDDDGRVYFYWGCSNSEPIYGLEVDPITLEPLCEKVALISENEAEHGWERSGENNILADPKTPREQMLRQFLGTKPFIEGAFMNKHGGLYYLQYSAPGTECNVYSDGVYVGEMPLGPFVYQRHNPFSSKPGGFITAAGHGSTFEDKYGNWWHASTMRISINDSFERRVGLFPCSFDTDGILYCDQNFADYPFALPQGKRENIGMMEPRWMLLSYGKTATASSSQEGHGPERGTDENIRTWWAATECGIDQWYQLDLEALMDIRAVQINFADHHAKAPDIKTEDMHAESMGMSYRYIAVQPQRTEYLLEVSTDGQIWSTLMDRRSANKDLSHDFIVLEQAVLARYLRINHIDLPFNAVPAISGLRVFGLGTGEKPDSVNDVKVKRDDGLDILLSWPSSENATGYNVRYGISPDKLYSSWQLYDATELRLSMVSRNVNYYIAVDSFNENGVSKGTVYFVE